MMQLSRSASDLSRALSRHAEAICRHYLRAGRKEGRYWLVGDTSGTPGRSLYVRLAGPDYGKGAAGKWTDAATGEHGDLLDLIALNRGLTSLRDTLDEARRFLSLPPPAPAPIQSDRANRAQATTAVEAARNLFAAGKPIAGTQAEAYLRHRGIDVGGIDYQWLRFHPRCYHRESDDAPLRVFPALLAAVTDNQGRITGVHRTWLDPHDASQKAALSSSRRAMGELLGNGVRFGFGAEPLCPVLAAGEGLETILSLRSIIPAMPMIAALSANHLASLILSAGIARLYIVVDADSAGRRGANRLRQRALSQSIEVFTLAPQLADFNEDLRKLGLKPIVQSLYEQLEQRDQARFPHQCGEADAATRETLSTVGDGLHSRSSRSGRIQHRDAYAR